jgi:DNA modification methylase
VENVTLLHGNCLDVLPTLPAASVHCVVTSPPYFGLRAYDGGDAEIGSEATPDAYVAALVAVFRELWRVLRDDGVVWLNLGDSYASNTKSDERTPAERARSSTLGPKRDGLGGDNAAHKAVSFGTRRIDPGLASKQLLGIPWRVAFALQADGWILRSDIVWSKPNCMPESVKDRPTKAHEYVFMLAKQGRYFYDADAVREEASDTSGWAKQRAKGVNTWDYNNTPGRIASTGQRTEASTFGNPAGRNRRSVWTIPTTPFSARSVGIDDLDHFAVMPPKLVEPCVLAGTSERGVCPTCGAPWVRVVERAKAPSVPPSTLDRYGTGEAGVHRRIGGQYQRWLDANPLTTTGWQPSCACGGEPVPATVLDPFCGAGTVGLVSVQHGRRFIGIDLNARYLEIARRRIEKAAPVLPLPMTGD